MTKLRGQNGYTLIELVVVLVIIGILAAVSMKSMTRIDDTVRVERTRQELESIAFAAAGDPNQVSGGGRTDYGYVGDVGSLPPNLDALVSNPGGFATWKGPYIGDEFSYDGSSTEFKNDAWGKAYSYSGGVTVSSTGGSSTITREIARSTSDVLRNKVSLAVVDIDNTPPGAAYKDSVEVLLSYPNGSGGTITKSGTPGNDGFIEFDSVPIGIHPIRVIYTPNADTLIRKATVNPGLDYYTEVQYFENVWEGDTASGGSGGGGAGGIEYVTGTGEADGGDCEDIRFSIENTSGGDIEISSLTLTWSSPTVYYRRIRWDGTNVFNQTNPRSGSGDISSFNSAQTIDAGETVEIRVQQFCHNQWSSCGGTENMGETTFTVELSDGTSFEFTTGECDD